MRHITGLLILASSLAIVLGQLQVAYQWKYVDYTWPSDKERITAVLSGRYRLNLVLPMDVDRDAGGRVFMSFLGMKGVPAGLGIVTDTYGPSGPLIKPYPDWSWFKENDCNTLQNVFRIMIDECNRLWVLDTGVMEGLTRVCKPKLVTFDLNTDKFIGKIEFSDQIAKDTSGNTLLATPLIETYGDKCEKTTVYIADTDGYGLIIIDNGLMWRLENPLFRPNDNAIKFTEGSETKTFFNGILGLALSPKNQERLLYFRSLSSYDLSSASVNSLKESVTGKPVLYETKKNVLPGQAVAIACSSQGTLFFGLTGKNALGCWNVNKPLNNDTITILAQDEKRLRYLNGVKVIKPSQAHPEEELWVLSNGLLEYLNSHNNVNNVNYHVIKGSVKDIIKNTNCDSP